MEPSPCCRCTGQGMGWLGLTSRSLATLAACCCLCDSSVLNQITSHSLHHIISVHIMSYHFVSHHITSYTIPYIIPSVPVFYWYCIQFYVCACVSSPFLPMVVVPHVQRWCALHLCDRSPASGAEGENAGGLCYGSWQFQMRSGRQTQGQDIIIRSLSCSLACCLLIKILLGFGGCWCLNASCGLRGSLQHVSMCCFQMKTFNAFCGSTCVVYRKIMLSEFTSESCVW